MKANAKHVCCSHVLIKKWLVHPSLLAVVISAFFIYILIYI